MRKRVAYWVGQGLLCETAPGVFELDDDSTGAAKGAAGHGGEIEVAVATADDRLVQELQVYWQYVVGMLTNLTAMSLDRCARGRIVCEHRDGANTPNGSRPWPIQMLPPGRGLFWHS